MLPTQREMQYVIQLNVIQKEFQINKEKLKIIFNK